MKTIEILIGLGVLLSVILSGWAVYEINSMKVDMALQSKSIESIEDDIKDLGSAPAQPDRRAQQPEPKEVVVSIDDDPMKGDPEAPVTIIEFSDYQCPFCKRSHDNVISKIEEEYIDTGKVRLVFRDYPLGFHQNAVPAALAANCGGEQDKYWEVHEFLFANPDKLTTQDVSNASEELGLDKEKFDACASDKDKEAEITADFEDGKKYGVTGTPSYFIGLSEEGDEITGVFVRGAQPYEVFKQHIDGKLEKVN